MSMDLMPGSKISWESNIEHHEIRLIGIGGKREAGKDTVADHLVDKHGWVKLGMSDPLDVALLRQDPYIRIEPGDPLNKNKSAKFLHYSEIRDKISYVDAKTIKDVRRNLMNLGTEVGRELLGEDTWVNVADQMIYDLLAEGKNVILTGVRFPNEIALVGKYSNGETWYVTRPTTKDDGLSDHASETSVSEEDFSVVINNDSDLDSLYETVDALIHVRTP
jgi:hypothetical protein